MRLLLIFAACAAFAQPVLKTEFRDGLERALVRHAGTNEPVTEANPAQPGEELIVSAANLPEGAAITVLIGEHTVEAQRLNDEELRFTVPAELRTSLTDISLAADETRSNTASIDILADDPVQLSAADVAGLIQSAAAAIADPRMAIAVVDRAGRPLAVYRKPEASPEALEAALSLARTGAFFSNNQAPLSSRTVRTISRENFPDQFPGLRPLNTPAAALFGIENTNRGCFLSDHYNPGRAVPPARDLSGTGTSRGITTIPGGTPLFRATSGGQEVIGGLGVAGIPEDHAEFAVVAATFGTPFFVQVLPPPFAVYIDGIRLPFLNQTTRPAGTAADSAFDAAGYVVTPRPGAAAPDGWLVGPNPGSQLTRDEVQRIVENAVSRAERTRAQIRLPLGSRTRMVISVADLDGTILALFRMPDSTIFSIDVAATKARNVVYFSGRDVNPEDLPGVPQGTAVTNRTLGFGAQSFFPSGINNSPPGPFRDLYLRDLANPCTQGRQPAHRNQSGIVFFPGSAPLYKAGQLAGGLGVSGDGVEQDDYVTAAGAEGFEPAASARADQIFLRNVRLPYWKFPRNPEQ
ncbi:MAG: heme-binding protein [Bryobacteraceae bacterium]|nr:heme-binding protein [Bryobacteraceae bacterium]